MNCNYSLIGLARPMLNCLFGFMVTCDGDLNMRANRLSLLSYPKGLCQYQISILSQAKKNQHYPDAPSPSPPSPPA